MEYAVRVDVSLKRGIADPEGATIERALPALGFSGVHGVRANKAFALTVEADSEGDARELAESLATRLLSNPVIEDAAVTVLGAT